MLVIKLIVEGLGLGALLVLICAVGMWNGAVGMVHLYDQKVQERVIQLGMTTGEAITCLDYSPDMMSAARARAERMGIENVRFVQGDVGALPFDDGRFDTVLSLNGFHAFPDKEAAFRETFRVLKPGGTFCGCFYIRGGCVRTDWFIKHLYQPKGFFTPPYETMESLRARLSTMYAEVDVTRYEGIACFRCRKVAL